MSDVTHLLDRAQHGDPSAAGELLPLVYEELRRILVENARRKLRIRHGGGLERVDLASIDLAIAREDEKCLRVHEALDRLAAFDPRKAEVVKLRLFTGLPVQEIATVLEASEKTVQRDWTFAKAWLSRELKEEP